MTVMVLVPLAPSGIVTSKPRGAPVKPVLIGDEAPVKPVAAPVVDPLE
jgi:hypothetical protein